MVIASWNVNSIRARLEHVRGWLTQRNPDVLLLQELKAVEFPAELFQELGYTSAAVTQKSYNGVAILSHSPIKVVSTALVGDEADSHARFQEVVIRDIRVGSESGVGNDLSRNDADRELVYNDELTAKKWALNSAVECHLHTVEVIGSNPIAPTIPPSFQALAGISDLGLGPSGATSLICLMTPRCALRFAGVTA